MSIADKLVQVNQVKQDIKTAIETKGIPMTDVAFTEYANKILEISGGGGIDVYSMLISEGLDYYKVIAKSLYITYNKDNLFENAWKHSLTVDPSEIERTSTSSTQYGKLQYPNGEDNGVIIPNSVTRIGSNAFSNWAVNNQPLVIPDSVTSIGTYAFSNWSSNNQPLVIPNSVTSIGTNAFSNWAVNNQPLVIPDSVTSIGNSAFMSWNENNQPLVIPDSVTSIGNYAFMYWSSNNHPLVIPDSVTSIGNGAFANWINVPYVEMKSETPPTLSSAGAFNGQNDAPIYVPDSAVDNYKNATNWSTLSSRIFAISEK